ncbi:MAG: hypothetical protein ACM30E_09850 [Nitrososphaerales archaeon]
MGRLHLVRSLIILTFVTGIGFATQQAVAAQAPFFADWAVAGKPYSIAVQAPGLVWATLPDDNALVRLQVSDLGTATPTTFVLPKPNSEPYDVAFAGGAVWFTERLGNRIGRLDPASGAITEFPVPVAGSQPTGLAVAPGSPTRVWFAERNGNALGRLTITDSVTFDFFEYPLGLPNARPESVATDGTNVWFTAPGLGRLFFLAPAANPYGIGAGAGSQPWAVTVDASGFPWITERTTNRVAIYLPSTLADFRWFTPPTANSDPYDIATMGGKTAFVERLGDRLALLDTRTGRIHEYGVPGAGPTSLAFDANRCVWVAENAKLKIGRWCPPYFNLVYLPLLRR